jgi:epsin
VSQAVIQLRLGYPPAKWRNVYKALTLLEFLLKRGAERCVDIARSELLPRLEDLEAFQYVSPEGRDQGVNVRHRWALQSPCSPPL